MCMCTCMHAHACMRACMRAYMHACAMSQKACACVNPALASRRRFLCPPPHLALGSVCDTRKRLRIRTHPMSSVREQILYMKIHSHAPTHAPAHSPAHAHACMRARTLAHARAYTRTQSYTHVLQATKEDKQKLREAAEQGKEAEVKRLLDLNVDPNDPDCRDSVRVYSCILTCIYMHMHVYAYAHMLHAYVGMDIC